MHNLKVKLRSKIPPAGSQRTCPHIMQITLQKNKIKKQEKKPPYFLSVDIR